MSRFEALVITLNTTVGAQMVQDTEYVSRFDDITEVSPQASYVSYMLEHDLLTIIGSKFYPDKMFLRGEFAELLYKIDTKNV